MLKCAAVASTAALLWAGAAAADQAVYACEKVILSELISPKSYDVISREVSGSAVVITYDAVNRFNAPLRTVERCEFLLSPVGWVLTPAFSETAMRAEFAAVVENVKAGSTAKSEAEIQIPAIEQRYSAMALRDAAREINARGVGPYPIPAELTALTQQAR